MLQGITLQQVGVSGEDRRPSSTVVPAKAGIHTRCRLDHHEPSSSWILTCAGMTR
ncbi:hypothetical protein SAMN05428950_102417 [Sphingomonas sp. OV641]|nr:hypothetical protein SAMN05428950_102417 [Sphingomonas sp. OV641]